LLPPKRRAMSAIVGVIGPVIGAYIGADQP
jgi:hypothetical protein